MLHHLLIRNLAVVDEVEIEPDAGLCVLTGETGAGKSILIDALSLALGDRADSEAVRTGADRAEISASFDIAADSAAAAWLRDHDLDDGSTCLLRRVVTAEGRSRGYINGAAAPMHTLRELGALLVEICGQQAHQSLGQPDTQRELLDQHGNHAGLLDAVDSAWQDWQQLQTRLDELEAAGKDRDARLKLLSFQVQELDALAPEAGEMASLEIEHRRAANARKLLAGAGEALDALYEGGDNPSAHDLLGRASALLDELAELDPQLGDAARLLSEAGIQVAEAADSLRRYLRADGESDSDLATLESRLAAMHDMARKHRVPAEELPALHEQLRAELEQVENADTLLDDLRAGCNAAAARLQAAAAKLSKARSAAAKSLEHAVTAMIRELGMPDGRFTVQLRERAAPGRTGAEQVEFRVSINAGLAAGPLARVASGGELSRISLAVRVAASAAGRPPTMIFDEVDAGIGGGTADLVGNHLRSLAAAGQVMCVTHLPQVASKGHMHFRVTKLSDGSSTRTTVLPLTEAERIEEISRMLGGVDITERTREHAREMLAGALAQKAG